MINKEVSGRKNRPISTVASMTDGILCGLNNKEFWIAAFIDLKKAFDTINHNILLRKLLQFGLGQNIVKWITNYLTHRVQQCSVNGLTSNDTWIGKDWCRPYSPSALLTLNNS